VFILTKLRRKIPSDEEGEVDIRTQKIPPEKK
jgi:hypothetical protein